MVYNTRVAGRFFVRDTRLMDSMRFGIYIKARGGVIFGTQFEGLSGPGVLGMNEPEWPEGPPPTHLWVQGCVFSQNNYGFMPRNRDYVVVDPADISIYTRHFRDPAVPDDYRAFVTHDQYANSHVKLLGNVFQDWRGMGISVRNAHNVRIEDNFFLAPVEDEVMRGVFVGDPALTVAGRGAYAGIHLDSVIGVRVAHNRFYALPTGDRPVAQGRDVVGLESQDNVVEPRDALRPTVALSFSEWFGDTSSEAAGTGVAVDTVSLGSARHRAGRLGAGLHFSGGAPALLTTSADAAAQAPRQFTLAFWACPEASTTAAQVIYAQGDARNGTVIGIQDGRWLAGVWGDGRKTWLDLGPAVSGLWQHVALTVDGTVGALAGFLNGRETVRTAGDLGFDFNAANASLGGAGTATRLGPGRETAAAYHGELDEFRLYPGLPGAGEIAALALRRRETRP
jgi:hypothetical protein